jgi:ectoine hydroxylase-related dioxygenase (phytanoyl-CoA dioxygenase family)
MNSRQDFSSETLPWLDRHIAEIDAYVSQTDMSQLNFNLREKLLHWLRFGFVIFEGAIEHSLIDEYTKNIDVILSGQSDSGVRLQIEGFGVRDARSLPVEAFSVNHLRIMDLHNLSMAGKMMSLHSIATQFLGHIFRDTVVAMQSLTFVHSTEQHSHQDFPYVVSGIPSHLAASWIALEDVHPDSGPLFYMPGSHMVGKFDWGNGLFLTPESSLNELDFAKYLEQKCLEAGLKRELFCPKKGDILFWHAGLVHGGSQALKPEMTRKSYVTHYTTKSAYPRDRRAPNEDPVCFEINNGLLYLDPLNSDEENRFTF